MCVFLFTVCLAENDIAKYYINDGILSYCQAPEELEAAVKLYVMDLNSNEVRQHYLPGSIFVPSGIRKTSSIPVKFPLAWSVNKGNFRIIFPNLLSDAMGRISFRIWSEDNIFDLQTQQTIKGFVDEDQTMRYKGYWHGQPILFMNSVPFSTTSITNATNHLWYEVDGEDILARIPLQNANQNEWIPSVSPMLYRWVIYSIVNKYSIVAEDIQHNDFTPLTAIKIQGKKIISDNGNIITSENVNWLIWGIDRQNKPKELRVFHSNKVMRLAMKDCLKLPKIILSNEDSDYILLCYDDASNLSNMEDALNNISNYLNNNNLLKRYDSRQPATQQSNGREEHHPPPVMSRRGMLDPLPPAEMERRKREFLAAQPREELFSALELKDLFTEPDYAKITDQLKLARTYDWFGKYQETLITLEKAPGLEARFELGRFLRHGRPGVTANKVRANELFAKIVSTVNAQGKEAKPEDICLAGRASSEYIPKNWDETVLWRKRAAEFFQKAIEQGYRPAYYYSQYYLRHSSDKNPLELLKALPTDNLETNAFVGALAGMNRNLKLPRDRDKNLASVKAGIQAYNTVAQCALGMLYLHSATDPNAFLRYNPSKAKFWLQRAAERGDEDAIQALQSDAIRRLRAYQRTKNSQ
jgi:TPR repeat protein